MDPNDLCVVRVTFANLDDLKECLNLIVSKKLVAYAVAQRVGSYKLELTDDEDSIVGYKIDENIFGSISSDKQDDILLELYTNRRFAGKISELIEENNEAVIDNYIVIPVAAASRRIRVAVRNLMLYHQRLENTGV